jgi:autophagy-related protein 17
MASPLHSQHPHLVTLVLQSEKALQHGEALCLRANTLSNLSANEAFDVLALNAKVKWITNAVSQQLKVIRGLVMII